MIYDIKGNPLISSGGASITPDFSPLAGKVGMHIGDSYTVSMCGNATNGDVSSGVFHTLDVTRLKMSGAIVNARVGSSVRDRSGPDNGFASYPMVCRVCHIASKDTTGQTITGGESYWVPLDRTDVGYITFMGGTNDSLGYESSVGTDVYSGDQTHIYGAMHRILETLTAAYPDIPILVILQPCSANETATENPEGEDISGLTQAQKSVLRSQRKQAAIREAAQMYARRNVHIVDCCFDWFTPLREDDLATYWLTDNLHLTGDGYTAITDKVYEKLAEVFAK